MQGTDLPPPPSTLIEARERAATADEQVTSPKERRMQLSHVIVFGRNCHRRVEGGNFYRQVRKGSDFIVSKGHDLDPSPNLV